MWHDSATGNTPAVTTHHHSHSYNKCTVHSLKSGNNYDSLIQFFWKGHRAVNLTEKKQDGDCRQNLNFQFTKKLGRKTPLLLSGNFHVIFSIQDVRIPQVSWCTYLIFVHKLNVPNLWTLIWWWWWWWWWLSSSSSIHRLKDKILWCSKN